MELLTLRVQVGKMGRNGIGLGRSRFPSGGGMHASIPPGRPWAVFFPGARFPSEDRRIPFQSQGAEKQPQLVFRVALQPVAAYHNGRRTSRFQGLHQFDLVGKAEIQHRGPIDVRTVGCHDSRGIPEKKDMSVVGKARPFQASEVVGHVLAKQDAAPRLFICSRGHIPKSVLCGGWPRSQGGFPAWAFHTRMGEEMPVEGLVEHPEIRTLGHAVHERSAQGSRAGPEVDDHAGHMLRR